MTEVKTTLNLVEGDRIMWPEHEGLGRHDSGTVIRVEHDPQKDGSVAKVVCTREWFNSGIKAEHLELVLGK